MEESNNTKLLNIYYLELSPLSSFTSIHLSFTSHSPLIHSPSTSPMKRVHQRAVIIKSQSKAHQKQSEPTGAIHKQKPDKLQPTPSKTPHIASNVTFPV